MALKHSFLLWMVFMGISNVFTQGTQGLPLANDPKQSSFDIPTNEDWAVLVEISRETNENGTEYVYGYKVWDKNKTTELKAKKLGFGTLKAGQRIKFFRVRPDASGVFLACFVSKIVIVEDLGNGSGREVLINKLGATEQIDNAIVLPMKTLDPITQFHDSSPPFAAGRRYFGQRIGEIYLVWLPGFGVYQKTLEAGIGENTAYIDIDGQGNVLDFYVGCVYGDWEDSLFLDTVGAETFASVGLGDNQQFIAVWESPTTLPVLGYARFYDGSDLLAVGNIADATPLTIDQLRVSDISPYGTAFAAYTKAVDVPGGTSFRVFTRQYLGGLWGSEQGFLPSGAQFSNVFGILTSPRNRGKAHLLYTYRPASGSDRPLVTHLWDGVTNSFGGMVTLQGTGVPTVASMDTNKYGQSIIIHIATAYGVKSAFFNGASWSSAVLVTSTFSSGWEVALDDDGTAHLLRLDTTVSPRKLYLRTWNGLVWSSELQVDAATGSNPVSFAIAMNNGKGVLAFTQGLAGVNRVYVRLWDGISWSAATMIEDSLASYASAGVKAAIDDRGRIIVAYTKANSGNKIYVSCRFDGETWNEPFFIDTAVGTSGIGGIKMSNNQCFAIIHYLEVTSQKPKIAIIRKK